MKRLKDYTERNTRPEELKQAQDAYERLCDSLRIAGEKIKELEHKLSIVEDGNAVFAEIRRLQNNLHEKDKELQELKNGVKLIMNNSSFRSDIIAKNVCIGLEKLLEQK